MPNCLFQSFPGFYKVPRCTGTKRIQILSGAQRPSEVHDVIRQSPSCTCMPRTAPGQSCCIVVPWAETCQRSEGLNCLCISISAQTLIKNPGLRDGDIANTTQPIKTTLMVDPSRLPNYDAGWSFPILRGSTTEPSRAVWIYPQHPA